MKSTKHLKRKHKKKISRVMSFFKSTNERSRWSICIEEKTLPFVLNNKKKNLTFLQKFETK